MAHHDLLIRGARVIDPAQNIDGIHDIAVKDGRIVGVSDYASDTADRIIDAQGLTASPGWIDLHVHVFDGAVTSGGVDADTQAGIATGVTTVVDAGSSGAGTWKAFRQYVVERSQTRVYAYLNVSLMPSRGPRHGSWDNFSQGTTIQLAEAEAARGLCLGIKVLASQRHCGNLGIIPMQLARQASRLSGTGLMVHLGEAPPIIEDVLELMDEGDILTHCWKGVYGGLLGRDKKPLPETWAAVERGVKFDIAHGQSSFAYDTARYAMDAGLPVHAISTDIHGGNVKGPVYNMATTMAKFLHLGFDLPEVIRLSTLSPAQLMHKDHEVGSLEPGRRADITLFHLVEGQFPLTDAERKTEIADRNFVVDYTVLGGAVVLEPTDDEETMPHVSL
ncbi:amidohydrolase/deacetylase family metallohydrolase [bacterium]|nr:amidohydrolase/deacetylase family metallohydrolase [bacterium]